ncbi:polyprenyl diphosphate synthase [Streptomyces sp. ACA25]|uniref:polyprenyl diphosphate synthase n=1 Tax=Streptomyces sp. ACA25 TaxID=3022596 RepID=UPI0023081CF6|nr:polyprenyl diphosphate synthase [Streptomyces sp. ACA25]MDB1089468.1 polyprenyl diphosphate synthase [Streptomyces sp. ACA25]
MRAKPQLTLAHQGAVTHTRRGRATVRSLIGDDPALRAAYRLCRRTARQHDPGIHALIQLMPAVLRPACWALWAAASVVDDLADAHEGEPAERAARVEAWAEALTHDLAAGTSTDPVRHALVDTARQWRLDLSGLRGALASTRSDAHGLRCTDWAAWRARCNEELVPWVDQVRQLFEQAGAPMTLRLDRVADYEQFIDGAQLTDVLTDLSADLAEGHLILPQEALARFPGAEADLLQRRWSPAVAALTAELTALARRRLSRPAMTRGMHPGAATVLDTAGALMRAQLDAVEAAGCTLLQRAPRLSVVARTRVLVPARLRAAMAWSMTRVTVPGPRPPVVVPPYPSRAADDSEGLCPPPPHPDGFRPPQVAADRMPAHVAVIMDGSGRWAEQRGLPRPEGHRAGNAAVREMVYGALEIGLRHLTLYAFSTENWQRGPEEVTMILETLRRELDGGVFRKLGVHQRWSGRSDRLPEDLVHALRREERDTRGAGLTLTLCVDYGGRDEIVRAAAALAQAAREGEVSPHLLGEDDFARYLPHPDMPDVDLLWRTGNEQRTSNFLPWQASYAELYFTPGYWPDNDRRDLWQAVLEYGRRRRRHGAVPAPLPSPENHRPPSRAQPDHGR